MPSNPRIRAEADQIYRDTLDTFFPLFNLPSFPPDNVPPYREWWRNEISVPPKAVRISGQAIISIEGDPQAGKTTIRDSLRGIEFAGWEIETWDEPITPLPAKEIVQAFSPLYGPVMLEKDWISSIFLNLWKEDWFQSNIDYWLQTKPPFHGGRLAINYRGPLDNMIFYYALASHKVDSKFTIPEWFRPELTKLSFIAPLVDFFNGLSWVDALIMTGLNQGEAQNRRRLEGKTYPGWVTDSTFYLDYTAWYGYFIENVWPKLHEIYGTGLLVLNGEDTRENNLQKVVKFIKDVVGVKKSKWGRSTVTS